MGYRHCSTEYREGKLIHFVELAPGKRKCANCGASHGHLKLDGQFERTFIGLPVGRKRQEVTLRGHIQIRSGLVLESAEALDSRPRRRWQTLFLSTGEVTLADKMREEGRTPKAGQDVRMVDIPVPPEGLDQAFEAWEGFKAMADHLRRATRSTHGTAIRAFLDRLCRLQAQDLFELEQRKVAWARQHLPRGADSQAGRVVDRFALAALAGALAAEWGIVPWRPGNAEWAAEVCLQAWLDQRGGIGAGKQERGLAAVLGFIERHGSSRFAKWDNQEERVANCAGFRWRDGEGRMDYLFHSEGWRRSRAQGRRQGLRGGGVAGGLGGSGQAAIPGEREGARPRYRTFLPHHGPGPGRLPAEADGTGGGVARVSTPGSAVPTFPLAGAWWEPPVSMSAMGVPTVPPIPTPLESMADASLEAPQGSVGGVISSDPARLGGMHSPRRASHGDGTGWGKRADRVG